RSTVGRDDCASGNQFPQEDPFGPRQSMHRLAFVALQAEQPVAQGGARYSMRAKWLRSSSCRSPPIRASGAITNLGEFPMDHYALRLRSRIATMLTTAALICIPVFTNAADIASKRAAVVRYTDLHGQRVANEQRDVEVFVRLDQPSVAELNIASVNS